VKLRVSRKLLGVIMRWIDKHLMKQALNDAVHAVDEAKMRVEELRMLYEEQGCAFEEPTNELVGQLTIIYSKLSDLALKTQVWKGIT